MALPAPAPSTTVLVTGASSGIGAELARRLSASGYGLTLVARREDRLRALADELGARVRADVRVCDLADPAARRELVEELREGDRRVIGVCNNAGFGTVGQFAEIPVEREIMQVRLNVEAVVELTGAFLPELVERGAGAILNVASTAAFQPMPGFATYAAAKAFVQSFSEAVHTELGGTGVSCTVLCPGPVHTEFGERAGAGHHGRRSPEWAYAAVEDVARQGVEGMVEGRRSVMPGWPSKVTAAAGRLAPRSMLLPLVRRLG